MTDRSTDKVAIITGASRGIGAGLVDAYCKLGYRVIANSRTIDESSQPEVVTVAGDVADPTIAQRLVEVAVSRFGRVDTLINNAGVFLAKPFTGYAPEDFELIMSVNTVGFFHTTQRVISQMLTQGDGGHIINVTSILAEQGQTAVPAVLTALTKGGLDVLLNHSRLSMPRKVSGSTRYRRGSSILLSTPVSTPTVCTPRCIPRTA
jgi:NAD(P)-dependent dehydrogenase (short-subunit alcohol dehydrogenase family)